MNDQVVLKKQNQKYIDKEDEYDNVQIDEHSIEE